MGRAFIGIMSLLVIPGLLQPIPNPQHQENNITIFNRSGEQTGQIRDGNEIQLEITLAEDSPNRRRISFVLADDTHIIAECSLPANETSCKTEPLRALGWYWDAAGMAHPGRSVQALDEGGQVIGNSRELEVRPRPVVMVHGFISSWETWKPYMGAEGFLGSMDIEGFAVGDGQAEGVMNTGKLADPIGRTNTIKQNAEILGQYIEGVKQKTGAQMVDLVVHSMGGMISRYYIDRVMQDRDVAQLIMLGSPMGGTDCSVLPASLGFYLPASLEIRSSYMLGIFNQQITHRHGIQFYDLAGTLILQPNHSPCTSVPNDSVVSVGSVNAIPLNSNQTNILHTELTLSESVFAEFVGPILRKTAESFSAPAEDTGPQSAEPAPLQFTRVYRGHVDQGGSTELTINIDRDVSVASFALYDPTRSTAVSVRGASGNVIELDPQTNGLIRIEDPASMLYLGYGFQNPKPGPWKVTVLATDSTPAPGADFAISVYFMGGAVFQAGSSTLIPRVGEPVNFTASLSLGGQPLDIQQGQAIIRHPDGSVETLDLQTGSQASVQWTPTSPGVYGVDLVITGLAPEGAPVERTSFLTIETQSNPSRAMITTNLAALIGGVLLILALLAFLVIRVLSGWIHARQNR